MPQAVHPDATRPVDTSVIVPASIRAGAARADELIAREQAAARGEAPPGEVQPPPQPQGKDAQPPVQPEIVQPSQPLQQEIPAQPPAPAPQPQPGQQPQQVSPEQWEQRYRAMKGRFDQLAVSSQQTTQELQRQLSELQGRFAQNPPPPPAAPSNFDEEDDATWGPDFRNAVQRRVDAAMQQIRQELGGRVQQVEQVMTVGSEAALRQELDRLVPNWNSVNVDTEFHGWLALQDEMSGVRRQDLVNKAWADRDAQRVAKFFNRFLSEAASAPAGGHEPAPLPAPNGVQPPASQRLSLTDLAAPGPARPAAAASPAAPTAKRFWTNSEIGQFYSAKNRGLYDRTPEDRAMCAAYEADIYAAQAEGRVRPG